MKLQSKIYVWYFWTFVKNSWLFISNFCSRFCFVYGNVTWLTLTRIRPHKTQVVLTWRYFSVFEIFLNIIFLMFLVCISWADVVQHEFSSFPQKIFFARKTRFVCFLLFFFCYREHWDSLLSEVVSVFNQDQKIGN